MRRVRRLLITASISWLVAGCGVPAEGDARRIDPPPGAFPGVVQAPDSDEPSSGTAQERLYMVKDRQLIRVTRQVATNPDVEALVRDLLAGPTATERADGITIALPGAGVIAGVRQLGRTAEVELAGGLDDTGRNDEIIAFAQVVCTLVTKGDVDGVSFVREGRRIAVPRADGSLTEGPLTVADYRALVPPG